MGKKIIYVPREKESMWDRFKKACVRDGKSMSEVVIKKVEEWMITHEPGNPQTAMTSFSPDGKVTVAGIEGRVRQLCMEYHGSLKHLDVVDIIKEQGIIDGSARVAMAKRVVPWLKDRGIKVSQ